MHVPTGRYLAKSPDISVYSRYQTISNCTGFCNGHVKKKMFLCLHKSIMISFPCKCQWTPNRKCLYPECKELTLKGLAKNELENVVSLIHLLHIFAYFIDKCKNRGKQYGPGSDCSCRSSLIWVHTVCRRDFETFQHL